LLSDLFALTEESVGWREGDCSTPAGFLEYDPEAAEPIGLFGFQLPRPEGNLRKARLSFKPPKTNFLKATSKRRFKSVQLLGHRLSLRRRLSGIKPTPSTQDNPIKETLVFMPKTLSWCFLLTIGLSPLAAGGFTGEASRFTVSQPLEVPGLTLRPGSYSIHVVDHLSERYVVRVDGPRGRTHSTFLAIENPDIPKPANPGQVLWTNAPDGKEYVRGWLFRGEPAVLEFVFPKNDAVAIAKSNDAKVPAIDPASEGRPAKIKGLSKSDLELVNLWLLSSTHVGPGDTSGGIQAEHYHQIASVSHRPVISRLPQTGSSLPWVALLGAFSVGIALVMRIFRLAYGHEG
jgi:LPXTG-motif cell wall-anchored protein